MTTEPNKQLFWGESPNVLTMEPSELFPSIEMSFSRKLNAITRSVILAFFIILIIAPQTRYRTFIVGCITMICIYIYYTIQIDNQQEAYANSLRPTNPVMADINEIFSTPTPDAPMGNVMPHDYTENPDKKPAPPGHLPVVKQAISDQFRTLWERWSSPKIVDKIMAHPMGRQLFDDSMRPFYTMATTTIPNNLAEFKKRVYPRNMNLRNGQ